MQHDLGIFVYEYVYCNNNQDQVLTLLSIAENKRPIPLQR
jgi:hypothetical protein